MLELRHLATFHKVASILSFTKAADELNYSQSTVTSQIRKIESQLGIDLFDRLGSRVQLTDAGKRLFDYSEQLLTLAAEAETQVGKNSEPSGILTVGTMESLTTYRLPPLLELFHHRYPKLRLSLRPGICSEICQGLRKGTFDVAFMLEPERQFEGVQTRLLLEEPLVLVSAPEHPITTVPPGGITLSSLRATTILAAEAGCSYRDLLEDSLSGDHGEPYAFLEFGTIEAIKRGAIAGLGVTLLPRVCVQEELASGSLVILPWEAPFRVHAQLAWRKGKHLTRELQLFIDETIRLVRDEDVLSETGAIAL